jgi:predicted transcriptional regulator
VDPKSQDRKLDSLVFDLVEWIAKEPRSYRQTMEAWRTSCPRLAVWEEAVDRGLVARETKRDGNNVVKVTPPGVRFLKQMGRANAAVADLK